MELFTQMVNGWRLLSFFQKNSILDVGLGSEYASATFQVQNWFIEFQFHENVIRILEQLTETAIVLSLFSAREMLATLKSLNSVISIPPTCKFAWSWLVLQKRIRLSYFNTQLKPAITYRFKLVLQMGNAIAGADLI